MSEHTKAEMTWMTEGSESFHHSSAAAGGILVYNFKDGGGANDDTCLKHHNKAHWTKQPKVGVD